MLARYTNVNLKDAQRTVEKLENFLDEYGKPAMKRLQKLKINV